MCKKQWKLKCNSAKTLAVYKFSKQTWHITWQITRHIHIKTDPDSDSNLLRFRLRDANAWFMTLTTDNHLIIWMVCGLLLCNVCVTLPLTVTQFQIDYGKKSQALWWNNQTQTNRTSVAIKQLLSCNWNWKCTVTVTVSWSLAVHVEEVSPAQVFQVVRILLIRPQSQASTRYRFG